MGFDFRLLGPIEAAHDQRPIPLGAPKQRALRQALGAERIETRGTGYRLRLASDELDLDRFERFLATGSESLASGRPADAADQLRSALRCSSSVVSGRSSC